MEKFEEKICNTCNKKLDITLFRKKYKSNERKNICKFCDKELKKNGFIFCRQCEAIYPATKEYFGGKTKGKKGSETICRQCERKNVLNWQKSNKEKMVKRVVKYQRNHMKETTAKTKRYKIKKSQNINNLSEEQWLSIREHFNNICCYCGQAKELQKDHFIPVSKLGETTANNIVPSCRNCNASKGDKDFQKWYKQQPFYSAEREKAILDFLGYKEDKQQLKLI